MRLLSEMITGGAAKRELWWAVEFGWIRRVHRLGADCGRASQCRLTIKAADGQKYQRCQLTFLNLLFWTYVPARGQDEGI